MTDAKFKIAEAVAKQIAMEQTLAGNRLSWNLTFQGFMLASYALVATAQTTYPNRDFIHAIIIAAGVIVSLASMSGVHASRMKSSSLKAFWTDNGLSESGYPLPFSEGAGSVMGRLPPYVICGIVACMWLALLGTNFFANSQSNTVDKTRVQLTTDHNNRVSFQYSNDDIGSGGDILVCAGIAAGERHCLFTSPEDAIRLTQPSTP